MAEAADHIGVSESARGQAFGEAAEARIKR